MREPIKTRYQSSKLLTGRLSNTSQSLSLSLNNPQGNENIFLDSTR